MQVFKVSMNVLKRNIPSIVIYVLIFLALSILFASSAKDQEKDYASFDTVKNRVAIFMEEDSPLIQGFLKNLEKTSTFVEIEDSEVAVADALYFRIVTYVLRIPEGFTDSFMSTGEIKLEKQTIPASTDNIYTDLGINSFFNTANLFLVADDKISQPQLVESTLLALDEVTPVQMENVPLAKSDPYAKFYFNYMSYSLVSILILGTSLVMLVWKDIDLARRTEVSPLPRSSVYLQKYLALGVFALLTWFVLFMTYFIIIGQPWENSLLLYMLNSLVFTFTSLTLSFLIGTLLKSRNAISAVSNIVALGPSFISGVFVPQELLGQSVLNIAKATPTYWYVTSNNAIASLTGVASVNLSTIYLNMAIVAMFGIGFLIISSYTGRRQQVKS